MLMRAIRSIQRRLRINQFPPMPVRARHAEYSAVISLDDDPAKPSGRLIDMALKAAELARTTHIGGVVAHMKEPPFYADVWPGEHYRLLAALVALIKPKVVIEIGTYAGLSALAMRQTLPEGGKIYTFDIVPWNQFAETCFRAEDFADGRLTQVIGDVSDAGFMRQHAELFRSAELIFSDGPKDGQFERVLLNRLSEVGLPRKPLVVFDDVRLWNMLAIWRDIKLPKLDVSSFGHWAGTGFVEWTGEPPY